MGHPELFSRACTAESNINKARLINADVPFYTVEYMFYHTYFTIILHMFAHSFTNLISVTFCNSLGNILLSKLDMSKKKY